MAQPKFAIQITLTDMGVGMGAEYQIRLAPELADRREALNAALKTISVQLADAIGRALDVGSVSSEAQAVDVSDLVKGAKLDPRAGRA